MSAISPCSPLRTSTLDNVSVSYLTLSPLRTSTLDNVSVSYLTSSPLMPVEIHVRLQSFYSYLRCAWFGCGVWEFNINTTHPAIAGMDKSFSDPVGQPQFSIWLPSSDTRCYYCIAPSSNQKNTVAHWATKVPTLVAQ